MSYLNITEKPDVKLKYLIMAFAGWADAGEAATNTVKYIRRSLSARKFADIDPEEFYDFTQTAHIPSGPKKVQGASTGPPTNSFGRCCPVLTTV